MHFQSAKAAIGTVTAIVLIALLAFFVSGDADAATIQMVALGASNTVGYGVGTSSSWAGRLGSMLKAKGYDVNVTNMGVVGDTSARILSRVNSIPAGTRVVVFDIGGGNDKDAGSSGTGPEPIAAAIRARGAKPVFAGYNRIVGAEKTNPSAWVTGDVHHHLTAASHAKVAATLLPQVIAAIGKEK
jgi:acyl-CoA thioesterase-1